MLFFVPQNPLTPGDQVAIFVSLIGPFGPKISPFFLRKMEISKKLLSQIEKKASYCGWLVLFHMSDRAVQAICAF